MTDPAGPAQRYYRSCTGRWRGAVRVTVTDPHALRTGGMGWLDRLGLRLLARWPSWLGPVEMHTTVTAGPDREILHTTTFRWRGVPLERSREVFRIAQDGRTLQVTGDVQGSGRVADCGLRARYRLRWWGVEVEQSTELDASEGTDAASVRITQTGPGFQSAQRLIRQ